ncbi:MAG: hypothetical protein ACR5LB_08670 [Wolbachia sp.]
MTFYPIKAKILTIYLFFLLSIIFGVLIIRRFSGTPGQLVCCTCIKDANTLENVTIVQATIRYVSFEVFNLSVWGYIFALGKFSDKYTSEW